MSDDIRNEISNGAKPDYTVKILERWNEVYRPDVQLSDMQAICQLRTSEAQAKMPYPMPIEGQQEQLALMGEALVGAMLTSSVISYQSEAGEFDFSSMNENVDARHFLHINSSHIRMRKSIEQKESGARVFAIGYKIFETLSESYPLNEIFQFFESLIGKNDSAISEIIDTFKPKPYCELLKGYTARMESGLIAELYATTVLKYLSSKTGDRVFLEKPPISEDLDGKDLALHTVFPHKVEKTFLQIKNVNKVTRSNAVTYNYGIITLSINALDRLKVPNKLLSDLTVEDIIQFAIYTEVPLAFWNNIIKKCLYESSLSELEFKIAHMLPAEKSDKPSRRYRDSTNVKPTSRWA